MSGLGTFLVRRWKRILANFLIVGGVGVLLYPAGTWVYGGLQQSSLAKELAAEHPAMERTVYEYFDEELVDVSSEKEALREARERAEREAREAAFLTAAVEFARAHSGEAGRPIGRIVIPAIGVDVVMVEGVETRDLREGPGHWPETPFPGAGGNVVVSGHRTTYGAPFRRLNELEPGDEIDVLLPYVAAKYEVTRVVIVNPRDTHEVAQRGVEEVSLVACHPLFSARQRILVQGDLVAFRLIDEQLPEQPGEQPAE
jgi:sortase A